MTLSLQTTQRFISFSGQAESAKASSIKFLGKDYLVVPVIMLKGDIVIRPMGSLGNEYVPTHILSSLGWDGRPTVPIHNGLQSANDPNFLNDNWYGMVLNTRVEGNNLKCDAYLDQERGLSLGGEPERVLSSLQSGKIVEVSTGCYISLAKKSGKTLSGQSYDYIWTDIVMPDHLAIGLDGKEGACSVNGQGCGALRNNELEDRMAIPTTERETNYLRSNMSFGVSDVELRDQIRALLKTNYTDAAVWIESLWDDRVIFTVWANSGSENSYQQYYNQIDSTKVEMIGTPTKMVRKNVWEVATNPVSSQSEDGMVKGLLATLAKYIKGNQTQESNVNDEPESCSCRKENETMSDNANKTDLVGKLVASGKYLETQRASLLALDESMLTHMVGLIESEPKTTATNTTTTTPPSIPPVSDPNIVTLSKDRYSELTSLEARIKTEEENEKKTLTSELLSAQTEFTEPDLQAMSLVQLRKLQTIATKTKDSKTITPTAPNEKTARSNNYTGARPEINNQSGDNPATVPTGWGIGAKTN